MYIKWKLFTKLWINFLISLEADTTDQVNSAASLGYVWFAKMG